MNDEDEDEDMMKMKMNDEDEDEDDDKKEFLYYCYNNTYYKVPTFGKIYKIIDFKEVFILLKIIYIVVIVLHHMVMQLLSII